MLTVRATKPVCATGWHSPQLSAPGHTRQRCTRLQADINQSLLVRTVEASLAAGISACRPQGEKGQVIQGHGLRPQVGLRTQSWTFSNTEARWAETGAYLHPTRSDLDSYRRHCRLARRLSPESRSGHSALDAELPNTAVFEGRASCDVATSRNRSPTSNRGRPWIRVRSIHRDEQSTNNVSKPYWPT